MTGQGETSGSEPKDPVTERTEELAYLHAFEVERAARAWLSDIKMDEATLTNIVNQKRQLAIDKVKAAREAGKMNDKRSLGPGLTIYLRLPKLKGLHVPERTLDEVQTDAGAYDMAFDLYSIPAGIEGDLADWYRWYLPEAAYRAEVEFLNRIVIDNEAVFDELGNVIGQRGGIILDPSNVVRIEGNKGELWQHPKNRLPDVTIERESPDYS